MSQHNPHHQTQYVQYNTPQHVQQQHQQVQHGQQQHQHTTQQQHGVTHIAPKDTQRQLAHQKHSEQQPNAVPAQGRQYAPVAGSSTQAGTSATPAPTQPLIAKGDWTKDLVQLAKNAELKKHALTLQLHTAHIISAHATLEQKGKAIQDLTEQWNKLESERNRLLKCLHEVNADKDKVDMMRMSLEKEVDETRSKIAFVTEGEYALAKADVDRLRQELGQPPLPSLQSTLEEKASQYLTERRLNGNESQTAGAGGSRSASAAVGNTGATSKRGSASQDAGGDGLAGGGSAAKRPRGRPKGSKNKSKAGGED